MLSGCSAGHVECPGVNQRPQRERNVASHSRDLGPAARAITFCSLGFLSHCCSHHTSGHTHNTAELIPLHPPAVHSPGLRWKGALPATCCLALVPWTPLEAAADERGPCRKAWADCGETGDCCPYDMGKSFNPSFSIGSSLESYSRPLPYPATPFPRMVVKAMGDERAWKTPEGGPCCHHLLFDFIPTHLSRSKEILFPSCSPQRGIHLHGRSAQQSCLLGLRWHMSNRCKETKSCTVSDSGILQGLPASCYPQGLLKG